jgi:tripartite-type tricarboxylate transporter receptor subunit TctC
MPQVSHAGAVRNAMVALAVVFAFLHAREAAAQDGAWFAGRQIRIIVGTGTGGGYDTYARLVARHLGKFIPGHPGLVVENMPGASGIKALNYLYGGAPADGSVLATFNNAIPFYQAVGQSGIRFKSEELGWIGSLTQTASVVAVWHTAGIHTLDDARRREVVMGATGAAGTKSAYPALMNNTLGTRFRIVNGYAGGAAVNLAIERGEVQGDASSRWSSWKTTRPDWVATRKIIPIVQIGLKPASDLKDVKLLTDYAGNDDQRQMFAFASAPVSLQQPFAGPPRMAPDRLAALRQAFDQMTRDPDFRAEADRLQLEIDPLSGAEAERVVRLIVETPPAIIRQVQAAMMVKDAATPGGGPREPE